MIIAVVVTSILLGILIGLTVLRLAKSRPNPNTDMITQAYQAFLYAGKTHEKDKTKTAHHRKPPPQGLSVI